MTSSSSIRLEDYLDERMVSFLEGGDRDLAIASMVHAAHSAGRIENIDLFTHALLQREKVLTTAIGMGIAIPHARMESPFDFFIALGIHRGEGIEWGAFDRIPVRLVFMIGGPGEDKVQYLGMLSLLTSFLKASDAWKEILQARTRNEAIALFAGH